MIKVFKNKIDIFTKIYMIENIYAGLKHVNKTY